MIDPEREELLSAYLDGEVSPEERARVEQWLAESSELRQMRDEFLAMRADLQGLPRHPVGHDLAAVVMHRSTTASAADQSSRTAPAIDRANSGETSLGSIVTEWWNRGSQGRRFLWPVLAVAAALAILVFDARQRPADSEFEVAQAPQAAPAEPQEEAPGGVAAPADQPSIMAAPEPPMPEAGASPAADSNLPLSAPAPVSRSAETRRTDMERSQSFFKSMGDSAPAEGTTRGVAPTNAPVAAPQANAALQDKREELYAQALAVETIICPVTPRYLEDRKFEKLLDSNGVRWQQMPIPPQLQVQANPQSPRTAPLESLGKSPLQSLYLLQVKSEQVDGILSQVPQADRLMEGNRLNTINPQQQNKEKEGVTGGVQVMLVAPVDVTTPAAPAAKSTR